MERMSKFDILNNPKDNSNFDFTSILSEKESIEKNIEIIRNFINEQVKAHLKDQVSYGIIDPMPIVNYEFVGREEVTEVMYSKLGYPTDLDPDSGSLLSKKYLTLLSSVKGESPYKIDQDLLNADGNTVLVDKDQFNLSKYPLAHVFMEHIRFRRTLSAFITPILNLRGEPEVSQGDCNNK
jgi:hypothetical protein